MSYIILNSSTLSFINIYETIFKNFNLEFHVFVTVNHSHILFKKKTLNLTLFDKNEYQMLRADQACHSSVRSSVVRCVEVDCFLSL